MDRLRTSIKKTTRPVLPQVLPRKRLFRLLDQRRHYTVTWISGMAGSGKTTLAASYLENRGLPCLWYQFDDRDSDPATFFYYLGISAKAVLPKTKRFLPLLTSEYYGGASAFARRYFESLCARIRPPFFFVFDDYHTISPNSSFHEVFRDGIIEVIPEIHILVLSRNDPPPVFAGLLADNTMRIIGKSDLFMSIAESRRILCTRLGGKVSRELTDYIHERTQGWAAGLILMAQGVTDDVLSHGGIDSSAPEKTFDYFAAELFDKTDSETKDFLVSTAFLPKMTAAMADALTGRDDAGRMLTALERNQLFTEKFNVPLPTYQYHPLFRDFLLSMANHLFPKREIDAIRHKAARILSKADYIEDAAELYMDVNDTTGIIRLVEAYGETLIEQGRNMILERWLTFIPEEALKENPWTRYWFAVSRLHTSPAWARNAFEDAFHVFSEQGDMMGLYLSWSGIIESTLYEWNDFTVLDPWIEWMEEHAQETHEYPSPEIETQVTVSMMSALMFRQPHHNDMVRWVERALFLARKHGAIRLRSEAWDWAITYYCWVGNFARAEILKEENRKQMREYRKNPAVMLHLKWLDIATRLFYDVPEDSDLDEVIEALLIGAETGIHAWDPMFLTEGIYAALMLGKMDTAINFLKKIESSLVPSRYHGYAMFHIGFALYSLLTGDTVRALEHARTASNVATETGYIFPLIICRFGLAQVLAEQGEFEEAAKELDIAHDLSCRTRSTVLEFMCLAAKGSLALKEGKQDKGEMYLRKAMSLGRTHNFRNMIWWWQPAMMADITTEALMAGIEVEYTRKLLRAHNVVVNPPPYHIAEWPWPLRITTLGPFRIFRDDAPIEMTGRAYKKPLDLLKALIAYGSPEIGADKIIDTFWPDADGDMASSAFSTTLNRLRTVLGKREAIKLRDGKLTLDGTICWIDSWVFTDFIGKADAFWERGEKQQALFLYEKAVFYYQGQFLEEESENRWITSYRKRLKALFIDAVTKMGLFREEQQEFNRALSCYSRGLSVDPTTESLYRRSMICRHRLGQHAEVEKIYRRCRHTLQDILDVAPSHETIVVYEEARKCL